LLKLNEGALLLGVRPSEEYAQTEFSLETGDRLLVYTDGVVEAENARGEAFGQARLDEFMTTHQDLPAEQFVDRLLDEVLGWPQNPSTGEQADDITVVVIDIGTTPRQPA
jgi:phosphoserine phosphatase RsbU/P